MSNPVLMARAARQAVAQAQFSLQSEADVPAGALDATVALAQVGAALAAIERAQGAVLLPHAQIAQDRAREAQAALAPHRGSPTVLRALEVLAALLVDADALARMGVPEASPTTSAAAPLSTPAAAPAALGPSGTVAQTPHAAAFVQAATAGSGTVPAAEVVRVDVTLGAATASNFYCRLWGNDVVAQGGLFVVAALPLLVGTPVRLNLRFPEGDALAAGGVVRWNRQAGAEGPAGFGVSLVEISPEAHQRVNAHARTHRPFTYPRE